MNDVCSKADNNEFNNSFVHLFLLTKKKKKQKTNTFYAINILFMQRVCNTKQ